ncbi:MAG: hypothetical protein UW82_C0003G0032 [candidate division WWE3 bacterium GW2011_GWC2_44_9]|uniref:Uncharacterized protein n=1 Tax=candidate division WWE3 bacterium GW2011_GWC2_44_9 TaxID=1619125 RepID=A0A0G1NLP9_UNCKA|nr:MAG: hypothetical protein UW82_C0003G0032 [candidate division WWE3 bacterium GW2011_GWC2_44_9]
MIIRDIMASAALAATNKVVQPIDLKFTNLSDVFGFLVNVVLGVGIAVTGDQKAAGAARDALTNAVIGFIVVIGAFTIRTILLNVIGGDANSKMDIKEVVNF